MLNPVIHNQVLKAIRPYAHQLPFFHPAKADLRAVVEQALRMITEGANTRNLLPRAQQRAKIHRNLRIGEFATPTS